jgi:hypothetical protein
MMMRIDDDGGCSGSMASNTTGAQKCRIVGESQPVLVMIVEEHNAPRAASKRSTLRLLPV